LSVRRRGAASRGAAEPTSRRSSLRVTPHKRSSSTTSRTLEVNGEQQFLYCARAGASAGRRAGAASAGLARLLARAAHAGLIGALRLAPRLHHALQTLVRLELLLDARPVQRRAAVALLLRHAPSGTARTWAGAAARSRTATHRASLRSRRPSAALEHVHPHVRRRRRAAAPHVPGSLYWSGLNTLYALSPLRPVVAARRRGGGAGSRGPRGRRHLTCPGW
jgi:hypothetical protein